MALPVRRGSSSALARLYRQQSAFQSLPDMRGNRLAGKILGGHAGHELAGHAKEAAESGFAHKGPVPIDGMGIKAGEQARGAADSEHAVQFNPDAHGANGDSELARLSPQGNRPRRRG